MKRYLSTFAAALLIGSLASTNASAAPEGLPQGEETIDQTLNQLPNMGVSSQKAGLIKIKRIINTQDQPDAWVDTLRKNLEAAIDELHERAERAALTQVEVALLREQVIDERFATAIDKLLTKVAKQVLAKEDFIRLRNILRQRAIAAKESVEPDFEPLRAELAAAIDRLEQRCDEIVASKRPTQSTDLFVAIGEFKVAYLRKALQRTLESMRTRCKTAQLPPSHFLRLKALVIERARAIVQAGGEEPSDLVAHKTAIDAAARVAQGRKMNPGDVDALKDQIVQQRAMTASARK